MSFVAPHALHTSRGFSPRSSPIGSPHNSPGRSADPCCIFSCISYYTLLYLLLYILLYPTVSQFKPLFRSTPLISEGLMFMCRSPCLCVHRPSLCICPSICSCVNLDNHVSISMFMCPSLCYVSISMFMSPSLCSRLHVMFLKQSTAYLLIFS